MGLRITWTVDVEDDASLPEPNEVFDIQNDNWTFMDATIASIDPIPDDTGLPSNDSQEN